MPRNQGPWPVFRYACFGDWTYYAGCYYALLRAVASIGLVELVVNVKMVRGIPRQGCHLVTVGVSAGLATKGASFGRAGWPFQYLLKSLSILAISTKTWHSRAR